jgi:hypothetical protein
MPLTENRTMLRTRLDPRSFLARVSPRARRAWERVATVFESPWVAFPLILVVQLKVVWRLWAYRDVTLGDTTHYFAKGWAWFTQFDVNVAWSPLYTAFYGSFLFLNSDPVWATYAHRVTIVVVCTLLVLAVLRRLLPPALAWAGAAWWALLPIVFDTLYEVHLFAAIPVLCVWLLLLTARGPWRRAAALALLCCSAVLVRNELSVAAGLLGLALAWYEWRCGAERRPSRVLLAYGTSLAVAAGVCGLAYRASDVKYPQLSDLLKAKHTVNMAQVYAFGYQQRHPEWTASPWLECYSLMEETFGSRTPTLREMIRANPAAVWDHFAWNLSLTPSGLQLLIFNRATGTVTPDYDSNVVPRLNNRRAGQLTALVLGIWAVGLVALWRGRREWWRDWLSARALGWVGMFAVASVVVPVILTQRPRPSYLFAFGFVLIAITGMCFHAATARWRVAERLRYVMPVLMVAAVFLVPRYFTRAEAKPRPVAVAAERILPFRGEVLVPGNGLVVPQSAVGYYVYPTAHHAHPRDQLAVRNPRDVQGNRTYEFADFVGVVKPGESFGKLLARFRVNHVYLDEHSLAMLAGGVYGESADFVAGRDSPGWQLAASGDTPGDRWRFYRRAK